MSIPAAESHSPEQSAGQVSPEPVTAIQKLATHPESPEAKKEDARKDIARRLVFAYVALLTFSIVIPMVLLWVPRASTNSFSISDARDLMLAMSGTLSGLVGILGFVIGYYFKELDKPSEATTPSGRRKKS